MMRIAYSSTQTEIIFDFDVRTVYEEIRQFLGALIPGLQFLPGDDISMRLCIPADDDELSIRIMINRKEV